MKLLKKPIFWIALFFLIRLVGITNPPLEGGHSWRQITGLMVARNFVEVDANPLYPKVDLEGGEEQIIGMEFPLLNYGHYLMAELFGYTHWYGRLLNLLFTSLGMYFFSRLLSKLFNQKTALYASLAMIFSIFFSYSRKMMPDTFSVSLALMALHAAHQYLKENQSRALLWFLLTALMALLSKITAGLVLSPLLLYFFDHEVSRRRWFSLSLAFALICLPVFYWYFVWNPQLAETYGLWYNQGMSLKEGLKEVSSNWQAAAEHFYFHSFYAFSGCLLLIWGLISGFRSRNRLLLGILITYLVFGSLYILKSGFYFHHHNYYIIPFVPCFALMVGHGLSKIKNSWLTVVLLMILGIESMANQQHDFFIKEEEEYKVKLESLMDGLSDGEEKVVILGSGNPKLLYLSHRKGWLRSEEQLQQQAEIARLRNAGAQYLVVDKHAEERIDWAREIVLEGEDFMILEF